MADERDSTQTVERQTLDDLPLPRETRSPADEDVETQEVIGGDGAGDAEDGGRDGGEEIFEGETLFPSSEGTLWITTEDGGASNSVTKGTCEAGAPVSYSIHLDAPVDRDVWVLYGTLDDAGAAEGLAGLADSRSTEQAAEHWVRIPAGETFVEVHVWTRGDNRMEGGESFSVELKGAATEQGGETWGRVLEGASSVTTTIRLNDPRGDDEPVDDRSWEDTGAEPPLPESNPKIGEEDDLNIIRGTPDEDCLIVDKDKDEAHGADAKDEADLVQGRAGDGVPEGDRGTDAPGAGGGGGAGRVIFNGASIEYEISRNLDGSFTVRDTMDGRDGVDRVSNVDSFQFADGTFDHQTMEDFAALQLDVVPVADEPEPTLEPKPEENDGREERHRTKSGDPLIKDGEGVDSHAGSGRWIGRESDGTDRVDRGEVFQFGDQTYNMGDMEQLFMLDDQGTPMNGGGDWTRGDSAESGPTDGGDWTELVDAPDPTDFGADPADPEPPLPETLEHQLDDPSTNRLS
ncbi:MAG: hypothetical protein K9H25_15205 [Rhodospirillum sp.]|nr:hypothetical protein [Rhodospirillum sp.]MCF8488434.1 hypothetical protein [Rhodospirillum sp.]MCF8499096.1 hypothetical protein [Rhodospirillum sp.]